ncbi:ZIP family zinc transporter [Okibacterium sp. HSC-33S16]|uniref:ZIP family metal transporter n=1 Tax=Okibacterium sp. HSC-33S16 TaxID=2910965 RepID=UPI0020A132FC|nr:ZIP family zinc transporter [Okibacterium sp. HSC-33S16]MCP2031592.1 ZIP family zinc transporter [Okibacterium sp. HSC-33S16]
MEAWLAAGAGALAGGALLVGAVIAWFIRVPRTVVAAIMAFGSGVLISALAFDLVEEAAQEGGFWSAMSGFLAGAVVYVIANVVLDRVDARNRRGSNESPGTGTGIAIGALLDGIPETAVLGLSMVAGGQLSIPVLLAIIISNIPEGLASTAELKSDKRSAKYVFGLWIGIAVACALSSLGGFVLLQPVPPAGTAFVTAIAAGAILAMICDTMIPEAFRDAKAFTGLIATIGFFASFGIHTLG